jgi:hypothetical protein
MMFFPGGSIFSGVMGVFIEFYRVDESLELNAATGSTVGKHAIIEFVSRGL